MDKEKKSIGIVCSDIYMRFPEIMEEEFDDLLEFLEDEHIRYEGATDVFMGLQKENKHLEQQCKKQKEVIDKAVKYIDDLRDESAERQEFYNCFPDDLYIADINELLDILKEVSE